MFIRSRSKPERRGINITHVAVQSIEPINVEKSPSFSRSNKSFTSLSSYSSAFSSIPPPSCADMSFIPFINESTSSLPSYGSRSIGTHTPRTSSVSSSTRPIDIPITPTSPTLPPSWTVPHPAYASHSSQSSHSSSISYASRPSPSPSPSPTPSSASRKFRFDAAPKLVKTPWEAGRPKVKKRQPEFQPPRPITSPGGVGGLDDPSLLAMTQSGLVLSPVAMASTTRTNKSKKMKSKPLSPHIWRQLPNEVYDAILTQLAVMYGGNGRALDPRSGKCEGACDACYKGDLTALSRVSKPWRDQARRRLYTRLWLVVDERAGASRAIMKAKKLRRTLRENWTLSIMVQEINVVGMMTIHQKGSKLEKEMIENTMASLVMASPQLQRISGFNVEFDHDYNRFTHALSTRRNLREKIWILKGFEERWDNQGKFTTNALPVLSDGSVANGDVFLNSHVSWRKLDTLIMFGQSLQGNLDYRAFAATFRSLPSLKHLLISNFSAAQFGDRTIATIPRNLESLRLQNLPGLTSRSLTRLADPYFLGEIRHLSLINLLPALADAQTLATLISACTKLTHLAVAQSAAPSIDRSHPLAARPLYASPTLQSLHWDMAPQTGASLTQLATCITHHTFPALERLRCPCDDGTLQRLCKPRARIAWPDDVARAARAASPGAPLSLSMHSALAAARVAAQDRLERARQEPMMAVVVTDESGIVLSNYFIRGFMGRLGTRLRYCLEGEDDDDAGQCSGGLWEGRMLLGDRAGLVRGRTCRGDDIGLRNMERNSGRSHGEKTRFRLLDSKEFFC